MIRITRNDDIAFNVNEVRGKGDRYKITFYTVNSAVNIQKTDQDVTDGIITLNGSELMTIGEGVMNFRVDNIAPNAGYNDGVFNSSFTRTTKYYIVSGVIIPDGEDTETVIDLISELQNSVSSEITRSTNKDNAHDAALANVYTKAEIDDMLDDIDVTVTETDPTVPSWAKQPTKPTYTASEVGALPSSTVIPSKTSDLTNDSGFVTGSKIYVGECTTAAGTMPKVCTVEQFPTDNQGKPLVGTTIAVKFTNTNTGTTNRGLDVNGTGSATVWYNTGVTTTASYYGSAGRYIQYFWDGTNWVFLSWGYDANTTYTNVALGQGYAVQSNSAAATAITATLGSYTLTANGIVSVKFNYDVPAGATLNINGKGAKAIYNKDAAITAGVIKAGDTATFIYNTYYRLISVDRWQDNTGGGSSGDGKQQVIIKMVYDEDNDTYTFTDIDDNAMSNSQVIQLLNDQEKDTKILYDNYIYQLSNQNNDGESYFWYFGCNDISSIKTIGLENYYEEGDTDIEVYTNNYIIPTYISNFGCGLATQYGTSTSTITASIVGGQYKYVNGGIIAVMFTKTNSGNATLNINSTGTKPIYYRNAAITANIIPANSIALFTTHGDNYHLLSVDSWSPTGMTNLNLQSLSLSNQGETIQLSSEYFDDDGTTQISFADSSSGRTATLVPDDSEIMTKNMFNSSFDAVITAKYPSIKPRTTQGTHASNTNYIQYGLTYGYWTLSISSGYASSNYDMRITLSAGSNTDKNRPVHTIILDCTKIAGHGDINFTNTLVWDNGAPDLRDINENRIKYMVITVYECKYASYKAWT